MADKDEAYRLMRKESNRRYYLLNMEEMKARVREDYHNNPIIIAKKQERERKRAEKEAQMAQKKAEREAKKLAMLNEQKELLKKEIEEAEAKRRKRKPKTDGITVRIQDYLTPAS